MERITILDIHVVPNITQLWLLILLPWIDKPLPKLYDYETTFGKFYLYHMWMLKLIIKVLICWPHVTQNDTLALLEGVYAQCAVIHVLLVP